MECGYDVFILVVLATFLCMLPDEFIIIKGGCPCQDGGCSTGFGLAEEGGWSDERVLRRSQDNHKVDVLASSGGTLD